MPTPIFFANLRNLLAEIYPDEASMRRVASDAGLNTARIALNSGALNNWQAILLEAERTNQVDALLTVVLGEYPANAELRQAAADYRATGRPSSKSQVTDATPDPQASATAKSIDIFLSYSRTDTDLMQRLWRELSAAGFTVWIDQTDLEPGSPSWQRAIEEALQASRCIVVLLSPEAKKSRWIEIEVSVAEEFELRVFPLLAHGDSKNAILFRLRTTQLIDIRQDWAPVQSQLIPTLRRHLRKPSPNKDIEPDRTKPARGWTSQSIRFFVPSLLVGLSLIISLPYWRDLANRVYSSTPTSSALAIRLAHTPSPPTATLVPTDTPLPPTATARPTNAPRPATATPLPTDTALPPIATARPTDTSQPSTATLVPTDPPPPPTATALPTDTPLAPTAMALPTDSPVSPTATVLPTTTISTTLTSTAPAPTVITGTTLADLKQRYAAAVQDAKVAEPSEVYTGLIAIKPDNHNLVWDDTGRVLVVTWTSYKGYDTQVGKELTIPRETWVTTVPELKNFCQSYQATPDTPLALRLEELLGLPPNNGKTRMVSLWVKPDSLFRPTLDGDITGTTATLEVPPASQFKSEQAYEFQRDWYNLQVKLDNYDDPTTGYPWTRLGYTYDWGNPKSEVGLSEFVIYANAQAKVESVFTAEDYCKQN